LLSAWAGTFAGATANEQDAPEAGIHDHAGNGRLAATHTVTTVASRVNIGDGVNSGGGVNAGTQHEGFSTFRRQELIDMKAAEIESLQAERHELVDVLKWPGLRNLLLATSPRP